VTTIRNRPVRIPPRSFTRYATRYQINAFAAFDEGRARFAFLEWHRRARKTSLGVNLLIREAVRNERKTYRYLAPTRALAKAIAWDDPNMLFKYLPDQRLIPWRANQQSLTIHFPNKARIVLNGSDGMQDRQRGLDTHGFVADEWAYHENDTIWTAVFRPMLALDPTRWGWFFFTPNGINHATIMFDKYKKDYPDEAYCRTLKASESGLVPEGELRKAQNEMPHALYMQEWECERLQTSDRVLIQPAVIERLRGIRHNWGARDRRIVACDVGFEGDECVIFVMVNTRILEAQYMHPQTTDEIIGALTQMGAKHDIDDFIVDPIGNGKGVIDGMRKISRLRVQGFDARVTAPSDSSDKRRYGNLRAKAWWHAWEEMTAGRCDFIEDMKTRQQLCAVRFKFKDNGALLMERKDNKDLRKRLGGVSPDRADAFIMGMWGSRNVQDYKSEVSRITTPPAAAGGPMAA